MINNINDWNDFYTTDPEVQVKAIPGDLVINIGGLLYLVQRENDCNNIFCVRTHESNITLLQSFCMFREWLLGNSIQYIRVEGNPRRYWFLSKLKFNKGYNCVQSFGEVPGRNVFYIKLY